MPDPYLYEDVPVLRNKLGIKTEKILDLVEAEQSRANMMLLYERPFSSFSPAFCLATSMIGLVNIASSISRRQSGF